MGVKRLVKYLNKNVYFTNLLLLPALVLTSIIYYETTHWKYDNIQQQMYSYLWLFFTGYIGLVIIASTLYHVFMFSELREIYPRILKLDLLTAPIFALIMILLVFIYGKFLVTKCEDTDEKYPILFSVSSLYLFIGVLVWILKRIFMKGYRKKGLIYKIKYLEAHTFFHYIAYTGVTMMLFLYLIENKLIYKTIFLKMCEN